MVENSGFEKLMAEKSGVKRSRVEKSGVEMSFNLFSSVSWVLFFNFKKVCQITGISYVTNKHIIAYLWSTSLLLETLNSSVNVIIYAVFNKKFRILFSEMFCNCFRKKEQLKGPVRTSGRFTLGPLLYGPVPSPSPSPFAPSSAPSRSSAPSSQYWL